jgi:hypothetical protein
MKIMLNVKKLQEVELSIEDCSEILIKTMESDWYNTLQNDIDDEQEDAFKRVYNFYSGKHLV